LIRMDSMDSKLKLPALKVARWAFKHGEFFDLYDVTKAQAPVFNSKIAGGK